MNKKLLFKNLTTCDLKGTILNSAKILRLEYLKEYAIQTDIGDHFLGYSQNQIRVSKLKNPNDLIHISFHYHAARLGLKNNLNGTGLNCGFTIQDLLANPRLIVAIYTADTKFLLNPSKNAAEKRVINHGPGYKANLNQTRFSDNKKEVPLIERNRDLIREKIKHFINV